MVEKYVKEVATKSGKKKFRAEIWYLGKFYGSKTFDSRSLAVAFKEKKYKEAVKGTMLTAAERRSRREAESGLSTSMLSWAQLYVERHKKEHGKARLNEYLLVGRLTKSMSLKNFQGRAGAQLLESLQERWLDENLYQCCPFRGGNAPTEESPPKESSPPLEGSPPDDSSPPVGRRLSPATVRLRMTALIRLVHFAATELPGDAMFVPPAIKDLFKFKLPPSHETPRTVEATDEDYSSLLKHFGESSDFGEFLQLIDETGCRLSEITKAESSRLTFFRSGETVEGGCLTLTHHKSVHKTKTPRHVPLSKVAATILARRVERLGQGPLFPTLGSTDKVCKTFDEARVELDLGHLLIKDFRRAFINRNKYCVSTLDMVNIFGQSNVQMTPSDAAVIDAVGHRDLKTTAGYSVPRMAELSRVFTSTSRAWRVTNNVCQVQLPSENEEVQELQARLSEALAALQRVEAQRPSRQVSTEEHAQPSQEASTSSQSILALRSRGIDEPQLNPPAELAKPLPLSEATAQTTTLPQGPQQKGSLIAVDFKTRRRGSL